MEICGNKTLRLTLPGVLANAMAAAATTEGKSLDELAIEAIERDLARRMLIRMRRDAEARRGDMTEPQVDETVQRAVRETRRDAAERG